MNALQPTETQISTREQRIERAAQLCERTDSFDLWTANEKCRAEGISWDEIREGRKIADQRRDAFCAKFRYERYGR